MSSGSVHVVSVHPKKINQRMKVIGHIPDASAKVVHWRKSEWKPSSSDSKY